MRLHAGLCCVRNHLSLRHGMPSKSGVVVLSKMIVEYLTLLRREPCDD